MRPWPDWTHSVDALTQVGRWLRDYHRAVHDYVPPASVSWRESRVWEPGTIIGHGDPAPYNAVWMSDGCMGFFDWDNAGPTSIQDDVAWVAFAWTPLHAREVVEQEGFTAFSQRRPRLDTFLDAYGWAGTTDDLVGLLATRLSEQIDVMRATAQRGDPTYRAMLSRGQDRMLDAARRGLGEV